jgi:hypothetical protein
MTNLLVFATLLLAADPGTTRPFAIEVVDDQTGRGVPLVELTTTGGITCVTDSAGLAAFDEPGLMGQRVFFTVKSHGYEFRKDGFGFRGLGLDVQPGGSAQIKIKRLNVAQRLYRVTGGGIYRDTVLVGRQPPIRQPLLNAQVMGSDSVVNKVYRGRIYWFWGDTNRPQYPLGNFHVPGATSPVISSGELDPDRGIDLAYFAGDDGFARPTCKMPGDGPTWIGGLAIVNDAGGRERMLCGYVKIKPPMTVYRRGIAVWNDETDSFEHVADFEPDLPLFPDGHPFRHRDRGIDHLYFATSAPLVRVKATMASYADLAQYEAFTCLRPGSLPNKPEIDRDGAGRVRYAWKKNTPPVGAAEQAKLIKDGLLKPEEGLLQFRDAASGQLIQVHNNSCAAWNEHRQRWTNIMLQVFGTSLLGEIWYAEADSPLGPWVYATKIITHDKYSFYNPKQHPMLSPPGGRQLYFEGTYTHTFSGNEHRTPRYDYNQIMYRLDLDDERLVLPAAVYDAKGRGHAADLRLRDTAAADRAALDTIRFFALDRPRAGTVAVVREGGMLRAKAPTNGRAEPGSTFFYAFAADAADAGITVPLYEYLSDGDAPPIYDVRGNLEVAGYRRCPDPICRVWPSPYSER